VPSKPVLFTRHAVVRIIALDFTEEDVLEAILSGERKREGKIKFKATLRKKRGFLIATCAEYPDHIVVITVSKRGAR